MPRAGLILTLCTCTATQSSNKVFSIFRCLFLFASFSQSGKSLSPFTCLYFWIPLSVLSHAHADNNIGNAQRIKSTPTCMRKSPYTAITSLVHAQKLIAFLKHDTQTNKQTYTHSEIRCRISCLVLRRSAITIGVYRVCSGMPRAASSLNLVLAICLSVSETKHRSLLKCHHFESVF